MRSLSHMPMRINNAHRHVVARDSKGLTPEVAVSFMQYGAALAVDLPLKALFDAPTLAQLAEHIDNERWLAEQSALAAQLGAGDHGAA